MEDDKTKALLALTAVFALLFLLLGLGGYGMMGYYGYGMMGYGMGIGLLFMLLLLGAAIWLIVTLVGSSQSGKGTGDPLAVLKHRYAYGEITKRQYEEMKREITK